MPQNFLGTNHNDRLFRLSTASKQALAQKDAELKAMQAQMAEMAKVINALNPVSSRARGRVRGGCGGHDGRGWGGMVIQTEASLYLFRNFNLNLKLKFKFKH